MLDSQAKKLTSADTVSRYPLGPPLQYSAEFRCALQRRYKPHYRIPLNIEFRRENSSRASPWFAASPSMVETTDLSLMNIVQPTKMESWAVINFSAHCDVHKLCQDLARCGQGIGIYVEEPFVVLEENPKDRYAPPYTRVETMFEQINTKILQAPRFLLCLLPERRTSTIYGPWKKKNLTEFDIVSECISPLRVNDQYLTNVLLKINSKSPYMPPMPKLPSTIIKMDVSHG